jgi:RNA polymerase primary sigma factor
VTVAPLEPAHTRLDRAAERSLVRRAAAGDRQAREHLVEAFLPLIGAMARSYRTSSGVGRLELMQDGVVGLLRALARYDAQVGPFWPYASWWVRQAMQKLIAEMHHPVVLSDRALRQAARVKAARRAHVQRHRREPSTRELAEATGLAAEHVESLIAADRVPRALEEPANRDGDGGTLGDLVPDPSSEDAFERIVTRLAGEALHDMPGGVSERERKVLSARYGLGCRAQTLREVADDLRLSAERVRQIETRALGKLREAFDPSYVPGAAPG